MESQVGMVMIMKGGGVDFDVDAFWDHQGSNCK